MSRKNIDNRFLNHFENKGYRVEKSKSLLPPNKDLGVLFMICGGIKYDAIFRGNESSRYEQLSRVQSCLRTDNDYRVGYSPRHLTNFKMLETFSFNGTDFGNITSNMIEYLLEEGIKPQELFLNIPDDRKEVSRNAQKLQSDYGVEIRKLNPDELNWGIKNGKLSGQRMEIGHIPTGWELWNVAYIDPNNRKLVDSGMASERLEAVVEGHKSVLELEKYQTMTSKVMHSFPNLTLEDARYVGEHLLTLNELLNQGIFPSSKGAGNKIRTMLKKTLSRVRESGSEVEPILDFFTTTQIQGEIEKLEKRFSSCRDQFCHYLNSESGNEFDLLAYLKSRLKNSNSKFCDTPRLLNEEYIRMALDQGKRIILPDVSQKELGKKYNLPLGLIQEIRN